VLALGWREEVVQEEDAAGNRVITNRTSRPLERGKKKKAEAKKQSVRLETEKWANK